MPTCVFFGHRHCPETVKEKLYKTIEALILQGVENFLVGNQGEFDRIVYGCLRKLRKTYPHICVSVVLAYMPAGRGNGEELVDTMFPEEIEKGPLRFAIDRRNRYLINKADWVVCYVSVPWGGAHKFSLLAKKHGKKVINICKDGVHF